MYNLVLPSIHIVYAEGFECCTLGHTYTGPVIGHEFFGSERVIDALKRLPTWASGRPTFTNLTAIRDLRAAVDLHLLDSLAVSPFLEGRSILDVGTGAGLPGLPLAILHPERRFVLLDASAKKVRFVRQVTLELGLRNVEVVVARVEDAVFEETFDRVMARAFASLLDIRHLASRFLSPEGRILALKGRLGEQEMAAVEGGIIGVHALRVPGLDAERHVVELSAGFIHG